ncbi:MAG TPA: Hpt domain-containing protein [Rudaea sp.]|jgi:chemosensory pili system protein ChpA (sensor histidine kinase/response regulator)|uniref:Hpt domain-containing protein n=1 Tax=Rudaea sp. TaxID=2136325 RepID=UPI002F959A99
MKFQDEINFTALGWVKSELDATLEHARLALEAYVENSADAARMRDCVADLHLVNGTLRMVELYGAALVVEEMERVADGLVDGAIAVNDDVLSVLMRGIVQLPDYLERLQSGHKDIPIVLLPLLNDLRAARGEKLLTESVLFSPDLAAPLPAATGVALPAAELRVETLRLRNSFQRALLLWIRDSQASEPLERMGDVLDRLYSACAFDDVRRLWWVANGVLDGVRSAAITASIAIKLLFGKVDREIKRLGDEGEAAFAAAPPRDLTRNLLYYLAHADVETARAGDIRELYKLDSLLPSAQELEHAHGSISGHNRALLDTVAAAIKEDLLHVKEALDIFLRAGGDPASLAVQTDVLDRIADTLGMLGLGVPRRMVTEQREIVGHIALGTAQADEATLLDVAGSLLYVEASLDDHIVRLGVDPLAASAQEAQLPQAEIARVLDALMRESAVNIAQVKTDIIAFVEAPWDHSRVEQIPRLLEEVSGAVDMLGLREAAQLIIGILRFVETELLQHRRVPDHRQMDLLADALSSIEYYLEATRGQRAGREHILDKTEISLTALNYWPLPSAAARHIAPPDDQPLPVDEPVEPAETTATHVEAEVSPHAANEADAFVADAVLDAGTVQAEASLHAEAPAQAEVEAIAEETYVQAEAHAPADAEARAEVQPEVQAQPEIQMLAEVQPSVEVQPPAQAAALADGDQGEQEIPDPDAVNHGIDFGFDVDPMQALDGEIREIFLEEVQEEIASLRAQLPQWLARRDDFERLKQIRRSFHTLKGSGRLVGAKALGDFAWKVENMLNRVLDKTVAPSDPVQLLTGHAVDALPDLLVALRGGERPPVDIVAIKQVADRLAAGEEAWVNEMTLRPRKIARRAPAAVSAQDGVPAPAADLAFAAAAPQGEGLPQLDALLFDVLRTEVSGHLAVIDAFVGTARNAPGTPVSAELLHSTHTLNGAIAMVELPQISQALMPLEGYVKGLQACGQAPGAEGVAVLADVSAQIKAAISALERSSTQLPDFSALAAHIEILHAALPDTEAQTSLYAHEYAHEEDAVDHAPPAIETMPAPVHEAAALSAPAMPAAPPMLTSAKPIRVRVEDQAAIDAALAQIEAELAHTRRRPAKPSEVPAVVMDDAAPLHDAPAESPHLESLTLTTEPTGADEAPAMADVAPSEPVDTQSAAAVHAGAPVDEASEFISLPEHTAQDAPSESHHAVEFDAELEAAALAFTTEPAFELSPPSIIEVAPAVEDTAFATLDESHPPAPDHTQVPLDFSVSATGRPEPAAFAAPEPVVPEQHEIAAPVEEVGPSSPVGIGEPAIQTREPEAPAVSEPEQTEQPLAAASAETAAPLADISEASIQMHELEPLPTAAEPEPAPPEPPPAGPPEPLPAGWYAPPQIDADLLDIFVQEAREILDHSDALMARLRDTPQDRELVSGLQRDLHTVKGGAHMSGLAPIGDLSHAMESLLEAISEQRRGMSDGVIVALEHGFDSLHGLVQRAEARQPAQMPEAHIRRIEALVAEEAVPTESATVPAPAAPMPAVIASATPARAAVAEEEDAQARAPQEQIRVRADLLDALVNHAGEVAIYRSRLEQQVAGFRFNLTEFDATVTRLREQLRKLELETEVQILSRYQRTDAGTSAFDPLELDRFSQLQQLSRSLSESVSDLGSIQGTFDDLTRQSETLLLQQSRVNSDLQEGLMRTRMVPFDSLVPALRRTLRQTASELGKRAQLSVQGAQGEMDRNLLERMKAPFEHMLRNALAHGIETPADREGAGKPADGAVSIAVSREATEVVLRVSDDGRGLDREAIRRKGVERGMLAADATVSDRDLYALILETGFSTAETVTHLSGRGVGMDVVNNEIKQLGGSLAIDSPPGTGAAFTVRLPFTLAATQAILVRLGESTYAIPMSAVQGVVRIAHDDLDRRLASAEPVYTYAGDSFVIHELSQLLGVPAARVVDEAQVPLLMTRSGDQRAAIRVDAVLGSREIVVKSVGPQISSVPGIFGATILGDGSVVMILDLPPLLRRAASQRAQDAVSGAPAPLLRAPVVAQEKRRPLIMVVDDSITMRKATSRVLERQEMDVITAKDGLDAVEKLQDHIPDLVVLDIEMPRMDGYEFATYMKNDARTRLVPIIMVTSRTGEKHRLRAREIGVERYLGKPYQEAELLQNIQDALAERR